MLSVELSSLLRGVKCYAVIAAYIIMVYNLNFIIFYLFGIALVESGLSFFLIV